LSSSLARRLAAFLVAAALAALVPAAALATVSGGCTAEGHATSGGVDLTTATVWHIRSTDVGGGSGTAPVKMTSAQVAAYGLGIPVPIAGGVDPEGGTAGSVEGVAASNFALLGKIFVIAGSASGDGYCSGQVTIIIDDVNPLLTLLGGGGLILLILGLIVVFIGARSDGGCLMQILDALFGGLGGAGLGLTLEQLGILDPTVPFGLGLALLLAILGFLATGRLHPREAGV
jgi:hypothetical protein